MIELPAGVRYRVKVQGAWVRGTGDRPFLLQVGDGPWTPAAEVEFSGGRMTSEGSPVRTAYLETYHHVRVRY